MWSLMDPQLPSYKHILQKRAYWLTRSSKKIESIQFKTYTVVNSLKFTMKAEGPAQCKRTSSIPKGLSSISSITPQNTLNKMYLKIFKTRQKKPFRLRSNLGFFNFVLWQCFIKVKNMQLAEFMFYEIKWASISSRNLNSFWTQA